MLLTLMQCLEEMWKLQNPNMIYCFCFLFWFVPGEFHLDLFFIYRHKILIRNVEAEQEKCMFPCQPPPEKKFLRLAHLRPSHSSPVSGHFRPLWQTLTLSAESHFPGAAQLRLMNFLGKEGRGYLGGHPNVSDIHQTSLLRKRLKLENGKGSDFWRVQASGGKRKRREPSKTNKQTALMQSRMIANGLEIWQVARA